MTILSISLELLNCMLNFQEISIRIQTCGFFQQVSNYPTPPPALQDKSPKKGSKDKSGLTPLLGLFMEKWPQEVWLAKYYNLAVRWLDLSSSLFLGGMLIVIVSLDLIIFLWFFLRIRFPMEKKTFGGKPYCLCFVMKHPTSKSKLRSQFEAFPCEGWKVMDHFLVDHFPRWKKIRSGVRCWLILYEYLGTTPHPVCQWSPGLFHF